MSARICYLGDDNFAGAAIYLAGIMTHYGLDFDHVPSTDRPPEEFAAQRYSLYVVSDYPAARFQTAEMEHVVRCVHEGAGLAMFGGWESFHGRLGEYHNSPLARALPVVMGESDDRRNFAQPCLVNKLADHPILEGLPWDSPPGIGGFNAFQPKPEATTLLSAVQFHVCRRSDGRRDEQYEFTRGQESPLLVVGQYGRGRTVALATDVAPHWVGGMVDWGDRRTLQDVAGGFIDVGNHYARFFCNLLRWAEGGSKGDGGRGTADGKEAEN